MGALPAQLEAPGQHILRRAVTAALGAVLSAGAVVAVATPAEALVNYRCDRYVTQDVEYNVEHTDGTDVGVLYEFSYCKPRAGVQALPFVQARTQYERLRRDADTNCSYTYVGNNPYLVKARFYDQAWKAPLQNQVWYLSDNNVYCDGDRLLTQKVTVFGNNDAPRLRVRDGGRDQPSWVARVEIDMRASFGWPNGYVSLAATLNNNNPASATGGTVEPEYQYQPDIPPPGQAPLFPDSEFLPRHGVPDVDAVLTDEEAFGPADTTY